MRRARHRWQGAYEKGVHLGFIKGKVEDIERMLNRGCEWDFITNVTEVPEEQYLEYKEYLKKNNKS